MYSCFGCCTIVNSQVFIGEKGGIFCSENWRNCTKSVPTLVKQSLPRHPKLPIFGKIHKNHANVPQWGNQAEIVVFLPKCSTCGWIQKQGLNSKFKKGAPPPRSKNTPSYKKIVKCVILLHQFFLNNGVPPFRKGKFCLLNKYMIILNFASPAWRAWKTKKK